jgi:hypothetical protein
MNLPGACVNQQLSSAEMAVVSNTLVHDMLAFKTSDTACGLGDGVMLLCGARAAEKGTSERRYSQ